MKQILVINFGGLGDEILFLPTLKGIKEIYPSSDLTLLLEPRARSIKELTSFIDSVKTFDIKKKPLLAKDLVELLFILREKPYDIIVSSGSSPLVSALLFLSSAKTRVGFNSNRFSSILLTHKARLNKNQYAGLMYYELAASLGAKPLTEVMPEITLNKTTGSKSRRSDEQPYILIHPGTSKLSIQKGIVKTYLYWDKLINSLITKLPSYNIILTGGPEDGDIIGELDKNIVKSNNFKVIYDTNATITNFIDLLSDSALFICLDSAPMHIACGLRKKLVALFGPTDPDKLLPKHPLFTTKPLSIDPDELSQFIVDNL